MRVLHSVLLLVLYSTYCLRSRSSVPVPPNKIPLSIDCMSNCSTGFILYLPGSQVPGSRVQQSSSRVTDTLQDGGHFTRSIAAAYEPRSVSDVSTVQHQDAATALAASAASSSKSAASCPGMQPQQALAAAATTLQLSSSRSGSCTDATAAAKAKAGQAAAAAKGRCADFLVIFPDRSSLSYSQH